MLCIGSSVNLSPPSIQNLNDQGSEMPRESEVSAGAKGQTSTLRPLLSEFPNRALSMPIDEQIYKDIMSRHPSGVTVVTTGEPVSRATGLTVNAFCTVSLHPPRLLVVVDKQSQTLQPLLENKAFTVSLLVAGAEDLAMHFASKDPDKFAELPPDSYTELASGPALVADSTAYFECRSVQEIEAGDHWILLGAVERGKILSDDEPLLYSERRFRRMVPV